jgi:hypothetical protein
MLQAGENVWIFRLKTDNVRRDGETRQDNKGALDEGIMGSSLASGKKLKKGA